MSFLKIIGDIKESVINKYDENVGMIKDIWNDQEWQELMSGKMLLTYSAVNKYLMANPINAEIESVVVSSAGEALLRIEVDHKKYGKINCVGQIESFCHNSEESVLKFHIVENHITGKSILSKIMVTIAYLLFSKVLGKTPGFLDNIGCQLANDVLTVNFKPFIEQSTWGTKMIGKKKIMDLVEIKNIDLNAQGFVIYLKQNIGFSKH